MDLSAFLAEWHNADPCVLVHTSGSTGRPKPMMVEKERMRNSARITCRFLGLRPGDTALLCMSLDYIAGKMMVVRSIEQTLRLVCVKPCGHPLSDEALSATDGAKTLADQGFSFVAMVPMQVYNSLQVPAERARLAKIRHLIIGGGAIDETLERELQLLPNAVWSTYGMTETLSHVALRRINGPEKNGWYQPFESVSVSLNADGCLVIDAPLVCPHPLVTNDIAELKVLTATDSRPLTLFRIKGRKDNVICSGGIKIQIEEVENVLRPHLPEPFMLCKKKDVKFGEIAVLVTESSDLEAMQALCRQILPPYWVPREFVHVDRLPLTGTGKPKRSFLMDGE